MPANGRRDLIPHLKINVFRSMTVSYTDYNCFGFTGTPTTSAIFLLSSPRVFTVVTAGVVSTRMALVCNASWMEGSITTWSLLQRDTTCKFVLASRK